MRPVASEDADFEARVKVMKEFMSSERFKHTTRPYKVLPRGAGRCSWCLRRRFRWFLLEGKP